MGDLGTSGSSGTVEPSGTVGPGGTIGPSGTVGPSGTIGPSGTVGLASTATPGGLADDAARFGTPGFYAALGRAFVVMCGVVPVLAFIEFLDQRLDNRIDALAGIRPRAASGLDGIVLAPFVHDGFQHLLANSAPLILLGTFVLASGAHRFVLSTLVIMAVSGLGVWFLTPSNYLVVGASGVIFGWLGLLLMRAIVERSWWNFAVSLVVGLLYGWQLVALLPTDDRVSWQGHLFGFLGGALAAILLRRRPPRSLDQGATIP